MERQVPNTPKVKLNWTKCSSTTSGSNEVSCCPYTFVCMREKPEKQTEWPTRIRLHGVEWAWCWRFGTTIFCRSRFEYQIWAESFRIEYWIIEFDSNNLLGIRTLMYIIWFRDVLNIRIFGGCGINDSKCTCDLLEENICEIFLHQRYIGAERK